MGMIGDIGKVAASGTGAIIGIANSIASAASANKARKQLDKADAFNTDMFRQNYYQDYMARSEIQDALNRQQEIMDNQAKLDNASAVVNGSTPELQMAQQNLRNKAMGNTIQQLASNISAYKDNIKDNFVNSKNNYFAQKSQAFGNQSAQQAQAAANGFQAMGQAMQG